MRYSILTTVLLDTTAQQLRMCVDRQPEDLKVLDEFLTARGF